MAEFQTVIKERERMCNSFLGCMRCPLAKWQLGIAGCRDRTFDNPAEAERIIIQWAAEHPLVTNGAKFEEIFGVPFWAISCGVTPAISKWLRSEYKEVKK
jgi:hypothetical protein